VAELYLDELVTRLLGSSPFDYRLALDDKDLETAYALRYAAAVDQRWISPADVPSGLEFDRYDDHALQVIGFDAGEPMSTGRVVLPPGLPTEAACGITIAPEGEVVDVGRMCVSPSHQHHAHAAFVGLMCKLYLEMRTHGHSVACGMMSAPARSLVRLLGLHLELLGPERPYWSELRAPVRFALSTSETTLVQRWGATAG
jgi:hypothetical protein